MAKKKDGKKKTSKKKAGKNNIQDELKDSVQKVWMAGLGALAVAEKEGSKLFKNLVEKGEDVGVFGRERFEEAKNKAGAAAEEAKTAAGSTWEKIEEQVDDTVTSTLGRLGVPTRDEIATLTRRVEELTIAVQRMKKGERRSSKPAGKPAARKSAKSAAKKASKAKSSAKPKTASKSKTAAKSKTASKPKSSSAKSSSAKSSSAKSSS